VEDLRHLEAILLLPGLPKLQRVRIGRPGTPLLRARDEHPVHQGGPALHLQAVPSLSDARAHGQGLLHEGKRSGDPVREERGVRRGVSCWETEGSLANTSAHRMKTHKDLDYPVILNI